MACLQPSEEDSEVKEVLKILGITE